MILLLGSGLDVREAGEGGSNVETVGWGYTGADGVARIFPTREQAAEALRRDIEAIRADRRDDSNVRPYLGPSPGRRRA
jgi:hypothetical protein